MIQRQIHLVSATKNTIVASENSDANGRQKSTENRGIEYQQVSMTPVKFSLVSGMPSTSQASDNTSLVNQQQQQLATKKRSGSSLDADSINIYKKRNLANRLARLKQIEKKHLEHVAEIFFLQTGGIMMEYPVWRKKGNTPELTIFMQQYRLDAPIEKSTSTTNVASTPSIIASSASPTIQSTVNQQSPQTQQVNKWIFAQNTFSSNRKLK